MTKYYLFLPLFLFSGLLSAQDSIRTLFKPAKVRSFGLYVAPEMQYGQSNGAFTPFAGGSAMLLFNRRFAAGLTVQQSVDDRFSPEGVTPLFLRSAFGGLKLEYTLRPSAAVHLSFPLVVGRGIARTDSTRNRNFDHPHELDGPRFNRDRRGADFVVIQPGVQLEANLLRNLQIYTGVHYRIAPTLNDDASVPSDALQGLAFNVGIKAGWFAIRAPRGHKANALPPAVFSAFQAKFPTAPAKVKWHRERNGEWEAEFETNGVETSANFDTNGQWLETETGIAFAELPAALQTSLQDVKTKELTRIQRADGKIRYEVQVKRKELLFDENGVLLFKE